MKLKQLKRNEAKFLKFNDAKLSIFDKIASEKHKKIFHIIPFLIHTNQFGLPGYREGKKVPLGIFNYSVDEKTIITVKSIFHLWQYFSHKNVKPFVQMLSVLGSCGSIAHNNKSDYDFWVVVNETDVSTEELENFKEKLEIIEKWIASNYNMEVHFFVNDISRLQRNIFANNADEAFGSALGILMKDEFFRASINIAGKIPLWNVVPTNISDKEYEKIATELKNNPHYVDIGNISKIEKGEFYGATLFQIIKTLSSPFKSVMKMGLLEKYLNNTDDSVDLLSNKLKQKMFSEEIDISILDPYVFLYKEIEEFYKKTKAEEIISLIRICFYLKVSPNISNYYNKDIVPYKVRLFNELIRNWKWSSIFIENIDNFYNWDFQKIFELYNKIINFILKSYNNISTNVTFQSFKYKLNNLDRLLIKRRINSFFSQEPGKIERILNFSDNTYEKIITFHKEDDDKAWVLSKYHSFSLSTPTSVTLKKCNNPLELVTWAVINGVYNKYITRIKFHSTQDRYAVMKFKNILQELAEFFNLKKIIINDTDMLNSALILKVAMIINYNYQKADHIIEFELVYLNSWGEVFIKNYQSSKSFLVLFIQLLKNAELKKFEYKDFFTLVLPENYSDYFIKLKKVLENVYNYFIFDDFIDNETNYMNCAKCYYFLFDNSYALIKKDRHLELKCLSNQEELLLELKNIKKEFLEIKYDYVFTNENNLIELIIDEMNIGYIQLFVVYNQYNTIGIVISNENNQIFTIYKDVISNDLKNYLLQLISFIDSLTKIIRYINFSSLIHKNKNKLDIFNAGTKKNKLTLDKISIHDILGFSNNQIKFVNCILGVETDCLYSIMIENTKLDIEYIKGEPITILNNDVFIDWKKNKRFSRIWITEIHIRDLEYFHEKNLNTDYFLNLKIVIEEFLNMQIIS